MPTALAQTIAAKYNLDAEKVDRVLRTDALTQTEEEIYQEVGKDLQNVSGGGIRYRSAEVVGPSRVEGVFTSTRDGKAYSFVWQSGKVTYQPVIAKTDSMTAEQHEIKWLARSIQLDNAGGETRVDSLRLHLDAKRNCGQGSYFCQAGGSGTCISVHKACSNDKQAVNHDRLKKINSLIEHLNQGGQHPSKALDKPDATKLQSVAEGIQKTRDLRAQNLQAKRTGDRMAKSKEAAKALRNQVDDEYWKFHYGARTNPDRMMELAAKANRAEIESGAARIWNRPYSQQSETIFGYKGQSVHKKQVERALDRGENVPETVLKDYPDLAAKYGKPKPATMTVGAIAPSTKAPQLIPQSKAITPEVLPPEAPRSPRAKRLANLVGQLQTNHEADIKNAAQIHAVTHAALQQLDPTHSPQLTTPPASTYQPPKGTPKQRINKLLGDLEANHAANTQNAAATYAVAQMAVNELAEKQGQQTGAKAIAGTGTGAKAVKPTDVDKDGVLVRTFPSDLQKNKSFGSDYVSEQKQKGQRANIFGQQRRVETAEPHMFTKDDYVKAWKEVKGDQRRFLESKGKYADVLGNKHKGAVQAALKAGKTVPSEVLKDYPDLAAKHSRAKSLESAPIAPTTKARTAGEVTPQYQRNRHISVDSITSAIARLQQRGTHIDSDTALELLRKADDCSCDECQHKDEMSKYDRLVKSLAAKGVDDPKALAAAIGRRKFGKKEFQRRAKAGKRRASRV